MNNSDVDVNILIRNYHSKISSLMNQNILLESKLESLNKEYLELQKKFNQIPPDKYQEAGIEE
jgi:dynactin complex subunit|tara:strand:- start:1429 stop:1617 length:189 start_codon:yes stop_codon:yes gene_type:complete